MGHATRSTAKGHAESGVMGYDLSGGEGAQPQGRNVRVRTVPRGQDGEGP